MRFDDRLATVLGQPAVDVHGRAVQWRQLVELIARDGGEALERLAADKPDAVVLDAMMPVVEGFEVLRRIREQPATANLPVIILSARKQERDIVGALELGASDFVVKPFIPEELIARLARLLGKEDK